MKSNQKYSDQFSHGHWLFAGDVATFLAEDLRPLQRVKGAHMVFTTALTFSRDEQTMLTVSADASALATKVSCSACLRGQDWGWEVHQVLCKIGLIHMLHPIRNSDILTAA